MSEETRFTPSGSSEYRIEKLRRPVSVVFTTGMPIDGEMFLGARARFHSGSEEPLDVLNDEAPFFPLREPAGETILIAKEQVAFIEADALDGQDDAVRRVQEGLEVEVTLSQGMVRAGTLFPETSRERPRLLDFLNAYQDRFLAVYAGGTVYLINRQHVAHVRALT
jgi:hypothetical protein